MEKDVGICNELTEFLASLKIACGLPWIQIGKMIGQTNGYPLGAYSAGSQLPSIQILIKLCVLGDQYGLHYAEILPRILISVYQNREDFDCALFFAVMSNRDADYIQSAKENPIRFLYTICAMFEIIDGAVHCLRFRQLQMENSPELRECCKDLALLASKIKTCASDMVQLWYKYAPNSVDSDIALQYYGYSVSFEEIGKIHGKKQHWAWQCALSALRGFSSNLTKALSEGIAYDK